MTWECKKNLLKRSAISTRKFVKKSPIELHRERELSSIDVEGHFYWLRLMLSGCAAVEKSAPAFRLGINSNSRSSCPSLSFDSTSSRYISSTINCINKHLRGAVQSE